MRFTASQPAIVDALTWALQAVSARPPVPALSGVRIEAAQGVARFTGFDYESMASTTTTVDVDTPGMVVAPGRATLDIIKGLPKNSAVTLETTEDGRLRITAGRSRYEVPLIRAEDYPKVPDLPPAVGTVDGAEFGEAVKRVAVAASKDGTLPILAALHVTTTPDGLTLDATDRYRIAEDHVAGNLHVGDDEATPGPWLVRADRLAGRIPAAGSVDLLSDGAMFGVRTGTRAYITQVTDGEYPKVAKLWPETTPTTVTFDRDQLAQAVAAISAVVERNLPVILDISPDEIVLEAGGENGTGTEVVPCAATDPIRVAYNPVYLRESLLHVPAGEATLHLAHPAKPAVITGTSDARALLMPVRLPDQR